MSGRALEDTRRTTISVLIRQWGDGLAEAVLRAGCLESLRVGVICRDCWGVLAANKPARKINFLQSLKGYALQRALTLRSSVNAL